MQAVAIALGELAHALSYPSLVTTALAEGLVFGVVFTLLLGRILGRPGVSAPHFLLAFLAFGLAAAAASQLGALTKGAAALDALDLWGAAGYLFGALGSGLCLYSDVKKGGGPRSHLTPVLTGGALGVLGLHVVAGVLMWPHDFITAPSLGLYTTCQWIVLYCVPLAVVLTLRSGPSPDTPPVLSLALAGMLWVAAALAYAFAAVNYSGLNWLFPGLVAVVFVALWLPEAAPKQRAATFALAAAVVFASKGAECWSAMNGSADYPARWLLVVGALFGGVAGRVLSSCRMSWWLTGILLSLVGALASMWTSAAVPLLGLAVFLAVSIFRRSSWPLGGRYLFVALMSASLGLLPLLRMYGGQ